MIAADVGKCEKVGTHAAARDGKHLAATAVWPGDSYPLGATYDGAGTNFGLFSEVADRVELCLFDDDGTGDAGSTCTRWTGSSGTGTCRASARASGTGTGCTAPTTRPKGIAATRQAAARPVRQGDRGQRRLGPAGLLLPVRAPGPAQQRRLRAVRAALGRGEPVLRLEPGPAAAHPLPRDRHLRGARPRPDQGAPGHPRRAARHLPGPGPPRGDLAPEGARRHGGRADARAPVRHRQPPERARACGNYWGYNTIGFFAPHNAYAASGSRGQQVQEFKTMVRALHAGRASR